MVSNRILQVCKSAVVEERSLHRGIPQGRGPEFIAVDAVCSDLLQAEVLVLPRSVKNGGWVPTESLDRKYVFYAKFEGAIWRVPVSGGEEQPVISNVAASGSAYAPGRNGIYFIALPGARAGQHLAFLDFTSGKVTTLADIPRDVDLGLTISPDESILLYSQMDQRDSDLMLIENFR